MERYISKPTEKEIEEVKVWLQKNWAKGTDEFDLAVDCSYDLEIFDLDDFLVDPRQKHSIPSWIVSLVEDWVQDKNAEG